MFTRSSIKIYPKRLWKNKNKNLRGKTKCSGGQTNLKGVVYMYPRGYETRAKVLRMHFTTLYADTNYPGLLHNIPAAAEWERERVCMLQGRCQVDRTCRGGGGGGNSEGNVRKWQWRENDSPSTWWEKPSLNLFLFYARTRLTSTTRWEKKGELFSCLVIPQDLSLLDATSNLFLSPRDATMNY
jgi:hypothetical protein